MSENPTLYRSFKPKYTHYRPDSTGRDNYININNGGFTYSPKHIP